MKNVSMPIDRMTGKLVTDIFNLFYLFGIQYRDTYNGYRAKYNPIFNAGRFWTKTSL